MLVLINPNASLSHKLFFPLKTIFWRLYTSLHNKPAHSIAFFLCLHPAISRAVCPNPMPSKFHWERLALKHIYFKNIKISEETLLGLKLLGHSANDSNPNAFRGWQIGKVEVKIFVLWLMKMC